MVRDMQSYERPADWDKKQVLGRRRVSDWPMLTVPLYGIASFVLGIIVGHYLT